MTRFEVPVFDQCGQLFGAANLRGKKVWRPPFHEMSMLAKAALGAVLLVSGAEAFATPALSSVGVLPCFRSTGLEVLHDFRHRALWRLSPAPKAALGAARSVL